MWKPVPDPFLYMDWKGEIGMSPIWQEGEHSKMRERRSSYHLFHQKENIYMYQSPTYMHPSHNIILTCIHPCITWKHLFN